MNKDNPLYKWSVRQLQSYMDAHEMCYQQKSHPMLMERHYKKYLLRVIARHQVKNENQKASKWDGWFNPKIWGPDDWSPKPLVVCPRCLQPVGEDGECDCTKETNDE